MRNVWRTRGTHLLISGGALAALVLHLLSPDRVDALVLAFVALAALPWLGDIIKSLNLGPSGVKVEYRDLVRAGDRVAPATGGEEPEIQEQPSYLALRDPDPNLALVGLRIEIEKRLNELTSTLGLRPERGLRQSVEQLRRHEILNLAEAGGLTELIVAGSRAAHGAAVEPSVFEWAFDTGPRVLAMLDQKIIEAREAMRNA